VSTLHPTLFLHSCPISLSPYPFPLVYKVDYITSCCATLAKLQVLDCHIVVDPRSKEPRGFAFVTMEKVEDARRCIKYLHRSVLEGRLISVAKVPCLFWLFQP
jgi:RNA recognition motif-containing protein